MGLLDKFIKRAKEQEQPVEQQEKTPFAVGTVMVEEPFQFTYVADPITKPSAHYGESETIGYRYGWHIECIDKNTPMKDVVMPDTFMGEPVLDSSGCFKDCYNVASVQHISEKAVEYGNVTDMFKNSGLREIPQQLDHFKRNWACKEAYALADKSLLRESSFKCEGATRKFEEAQREIKRYSEYRDREVSLIGDEFSPYVKFEKVSFVYSFNPISVIRAQDSNGKWFAINPDGPKHSGKSYSYLDRTPWDSSFVPYEAYMERFDKTLIHGLTVDSFTEVSAEVARDAVMESYDTCIGQLEKTLKTTKETMEKAYELLDIIIATETAKADVAQAGLDFVLRNQKNDVKISNFDKGDDRDTF